MLLRGHAPPGVQTQPLSGLLGPVLPAPRARLHPLGPGFFLLGPTGHLPRACHCCGAASPLELQLLPCHAMRRCFAAVDPSRAAKLILHLGLEPAAPRLPSHGPAPWKAHSLPQQLLLNPAPCSGIFIKADPLGQEEG